MRHWHGMTRLVGVWLSLVMASACLASSSQSEATGSSGPTASQPQTGDASIVVQPADCASGHACSCGDGQVESNEECDYAAPGWQDICDDRCQRTVYEACLDSGHCFGAEARCAGYAGSDQTFCAEFCGDDRACVALPGFASICNLAWCAVLCRDGVCPHGMTCIRDQNVLDHTGEIRGRFDICSISESTRTGAHAL